MGYSNSSVLVVSGTSKTGSALARKVAEAGGTVGFTYHTEQERAESLLEELGDSHRAWQCDVTDADATNEMVNDVFDTFEQVDAIVYTVGTIKPASISDLSPETWQQHLEINVTGAYNLIHAASSHLESQETGAIAALSASPGVLRKSEFAAYDAGKQGLEALVKETARDLGQHGIRANVVAPGFMGDPETLPDEKRAGLLDQVPYKRITRPEDVADACFYLCSDEAAAITGTVLPVDSGLAL